MERWTLDSLDEGPVDGVGHLHDLTTWIGPGVTK